ncbi:9816_t:CDS:2, partial [Entrophospora sp. SA101]
HNDDGYKDDDEQYDSSKEFGWDNESSRKEVGIESFKIHSRPVTNGEYLKFIRATHIKHAEWKGMRLLSEEELSALYAIHKSSPPINIKRNNNRYTKVVAANHNHSVENINNLVNKNVFRPISRYCTNRSHRRGYRRHPSWKN